ncbi:MAG: PmoA family protein [Verrucomicrobia bacterium]|nr:PmoA family protein [Verrucomicrobiota bacterium]
MFTRKVAPALFTLLASCCLFSAVAGGKEGVLITEQTGKLRVEINGELFTEYVYEGARRPYFYPVIGSTGENMTRHWPMKDGVAGEEKDHVHHTGLWYGHRHVNGLGFWENSAKEPGKLGTIKHDRFVSVKSGQDAGEFREISKWVADADGKLVLTEERTVRIHNRKEGRVMDFEITFTAPRDGEVVFGDDKDGALAIRVPESSRVQKPKEKGQKKAAPGEGHIVLSTGQRDSEAWGKRAAWCDYFGPVNGKTAGVAIFDHPGNPRHPTWWHVREYGLFAANPFGKAQFEKLPEKDAGDFKLPAGQSATWRYRFYFHAGDEQQAKVAGHYQEYVKSTAVKKK